jgi:anti-anti-sigma factor
VAVPAGEILVEELEHHVAVVKLVGELDYANAADLTDTFHERLRRDENLVVDLSESTFIDSSIIRALVRGHREATVQDRSLVLQLGPGATVERLIELVSLEDAIPRGHTRTEALQLL